MKGAARLVLLAGAVAVGLLLWRSSPRDVVLVYAVEDATARTLEVEVARGAEVLRRSEFRLAAGGPRQVRHEVRLPDGEYVLHLTVRGGDGAARRLDRTITVTESGSIVVPIGA